MLLELENTSHTTYVLTLQGCYEKYPAVKVDTGHGIVDKVQPQYYFVGGCLVTVRP